MYKQIEFQIKGIVPCIQHNGQLADPMNPIVKEIKKVSSKRKKTDDDLRLMGELEWLGGLYTTEPLEFKFASNGNGRLLNVSGGGEVCWPGENLESMLIAAAKINKLGKLFQSGIIIDGNFPLAYQGKESIPSLFQKDDYFYVRSVVIQRNRVMRTRPIFSNWALSFTVNYLPDVIDQSQIVEAVKIAGVRIGLSEYKPRFGRFTVEHIEMN